MTSRAVAFTQPDRGAAFYWVGVDERWWKSEVDDVFNMAAVAAACVGRTDAFGCFLRCFLGSHDELLVLVRYYVERVGDLLLCLVCSCSEVMFEEGVRRNKVMRWSEIMVPTFLIYLEID